MPFKSEKQRKWMHINNPKMAKKWEKEEKLKKETKVRALIKKMVREIMDEARVKLATKKDVEFHGNIAQLIGKNHMMGLDKKSLVYLL